jgi:hypothetical protein
MVECSCSEADDGFACIARNWLNCYRRQNVRDGAKLDALGRDRTYGDVNHQRASSMAIHIQSQPKKMDWI